MSRIEDFFREKKHAKADGTWTGAASFRDADGQVIPWRIRTISTAENEALRAQATDGEGVMQMVPYLLSLATATVTEPALDDAALQDAWGVLAPEALLYAMLTPGEYASLCRAVLAQNDFPVRMEEAIAEAKK